MADSREKVEKTSANPSDESRGKELKELSSDGRSGDEVEKHPSVPSRNERSSYGSSDSGAMADVTENFNGLGIKGKPKTEYGNETPERKRDSSVASRTNVPVPRGLNFGRPPERKDHDGEMMEGHPWRCEKPNTEETIKETVNQSKVYTVPKVYTVFKDGKVHVNLKLIYSNLPEFIDEMKGLSIRQELENVLNSKLLQVKHTPHVLEIFQIQEHILPNDKPSRLKPSENNDFKAFSLRPPLRPPSGKRWLLDCEYMLKMHLPDDSLKWFNNDDQDGKRIREIKPEKMEERWVFIPSFRRAKIALLKWPKDDIVTQESTIRILVVRPSEFEDYVKCCGHEFPVICLPQDEIGAGYPRYWIQKIALRLKLQFIWMIDDSVECFYENHPDQPPPKRENGKYNYTDYRRRKFGLVFKRIEKLVKATRNEELPIAAMSPRRFMGHKNLKKPFVCKPPQIAVFLNLEALKSKEVYYRPELQTFEDMIFGHECEKNGLKVFMDNRVGLQDRMWKDTGARSPSVQKTTT